MSTVNSTQSVQDLARTLMQNFDSNKDGQVSTQEFGTFLTQLLSGINGAGTAAYKGSALGTSPVTTNPTVTGSSAVKFEGFDFAAVKDPAKSAKYAFATAAKKAGTMPTSKADAEQWFNSSIKGEMERLGHRIDWVKGDKFQFTNWQGTFTVDYVRGAGSGNPALAWQVE